MKIRCDIVIEYDSIAIAKTVRRATKVDDSDFVTSSSRGKRLEATIESTSIASLIHTLDDYLACVSIAEKIVDKN